MFFVIGDNLVVAAFKKQLFVFDLNEFKLKKIHDDHSPKEDVIRVLKNGKLLRIRQRNSVSVIQQFREDDGNLESIREIICEKSWQKASTVSHFLSAKNDGILTTTNLTTGKTFSAKYSRSDENFVAGAILTANYK